MPKQYEPGTTARKHNVMVRMNHYERSNLSYGAALFNKQREIDGEPPITSEAEFIRFAVARLVNEAKRRRDDYGIVKPPGAPIPAVNPA